LPREARTPDDRRREAPKVVRVGGWVREGVAASLKGGFGGFTPEKMFGTERPLTADPRNYVAYVGAHTPGPDDGLAAGRPEAQSVGGRPAGEWVREGSPLPAKTRN
jgi:hypothetical protein